MITEHKSLWRHPKAPIITLSCMTVLSIFTLVAVPAQADDIDLDSDRNIELVNQSVATEIIASSQSENHTTSDSRDSLLPETKQSGTQNDPTANDRSQHLTPTVEPSDTPAAIEGTQESSSSTIQSTTDTTISSNLEQPQGYDRLTSVDNSTYQDRQTQTNQFIQIDGQTRFLDQNGQMVTGFKTIDDRLYYFDTSTGNLIKNQVINLDGKDYTLDKDGTVNLTGLHEISGNKYYFKEDGNLYKGLWQKDDKSYYFDNKDGHMLTNTFAEIYSNGSARYSTELYLGPDGSALNGWFEVNDNLYHADNNGLLRFGYKPGPGHSGDRSIFIDGEVYYSDGWSLIWRNRFLTLDNGVYGTAYLDNKGHKVTGFQTIGNYNYYFDPETYAMYQNRKLFSYKSDDPNDSRNGTYQIDGKGHLIKLSKTHNTYVSLDTSSSEYQSHIIWYYLDDNGDILTGPQIIDSVQVYFDQDGNQIKGAVAPDGNYYDQHSGRLLTGLFERRENHFYDMVSGQMATNRYLEFEGSWFYVNKNGDILTGSHTIDNVAVYFDNQGRQVKNNFADDGHFYEGKFGQLMTSSFVTPGDNHWYYVDDKGNKVTGLQTINNRTYYFDENGRQVKGKRVILNNKGYYFHPENGELWNGRFLTLSKTHYNNTSVNYYNGIPSHSYYIIEEPETYYYDDGNLFTGHKTINGKEYYFQPRMLTSSKLQNPDGTESYYNQHGVKVYNNWDKLLIKYLDNYAWTPRVYADEKGNLVHGFKYIKGALYYFDDTGSLRDDGPGQPNPLFKVNGNLYLADFYGNYGDNRAAIVTNRLFSYYGDDHIFLHTFRADELGRLTEVTDKNTWIPHGDKWYYLDGEGKVLIGPQTIDGVHVYFHKDGKQAKGELVTKEGVTYYYDEHTGARAENTTLTIDDVTYRFDQDGRGTIVS